MMNKDIEIYVRLLDEGSPTIRRTHAAFLADNLYRLLPAADYDPEDEIWEILPGSIVKAVPHEDAKGNPLLLAVKPDHE